jgi:hypothetical protein
MSNFIDLTDDDNLPENHHISESSSSKRQRTNEVLSLHGFSRPTIMAGSQAPVQANQHLFINAGNPISNVVFSTPQSVNEALERGNAIFSA